MSGTKRVESDIKGSELTMRALADTKGMQTPERAAFWLEKLTAATHRGRHDTWTAARDRAAKAAGVELSTARRIWQRWQYMNDVSGTPLLKLMLAYEALCVKIEASADAMEREHFNLMADRKNADSESDPALGAGTEKVAPRAPE